MVEDWVDNVIWYLDFFSNSRVLLDFYDLPEGSITVDTYEDFLLSKFNTVEEGIANFNLANCSITDNLDKVMFYILHLIYNKKFSKK